MKENTNNTEYKFVLWGFGKRGRRFLKRCAYKNVCAIIDSNVELQGSYVEGIEIISFEQYLDNYRDFEIVIAVDSNEAIKETLKKANINTFFLIEDTPHEILGYSGSGWLEDLPITIEDEKNYVIYGLNIYSFLLREYLSKQYGKSVEIIAESFEERKNGFMKKYPFVTDISMLEDAGNIEVLWASRFQDEKEKVSKNIQDVFDFMKKIESYHNNELEKYHNYTQNEKCIIVATGPSLKMEDLERIHELNIPTFGVNKIYLAFENVVWRPNYFVVMDDKMMLTYSEEMLGADVETKFFSDVVDIGDLTDSYGDINRIHDHVLEYYPYEAKFSDNICEGVYSGRTVVYSCIQIAIYMGYKEIYIIGADHNYSNNQKDVQNHFHKDYYKGNIRPDNYFKEKAELAYLSARKFAEKNGVKIYNATRGGHLEVFERADLDELLELKG